MKDIYNIGELVKELNINKETIRYYEKIGLLSEPKKDENGYRIYSKKDIEIIRFILIVKNLGFSLREISILMHDEILCGNIEDIKKIVESKINEVNEKINNLEETKKLLEKVKGTILSKNIEGCEDIEIYLKK
ncbi:MerR family transcriptional regulator [Clostridium cellulovorans]|uniref:Transcriptional regulator, MerR family n=1 Tax=Clostridium cellulovorans (strain ATCC 35296 / DSM 3052 / OCM 3 / 743B) TaxID=573061 RepID=D9SUY1_CLOC7|nr:MerR family transcriptional regulator [Clostridium cellulovorans]ADL52956.1 transcriptional regulator, MerR family [Clostridium cellulovorans 743B]